MKISKISALPAALLITLLCATHDSAADTFDFGGSPEKFKGVGDREPPRCQFNVPRAATSPFFVTWNCIDDASADDEIVSELWILRKDAEAPRKIADFLGFPASVQIDEAILQSATVVDGLPASFRLVARDRAGIATISKYYPVVSQDNSVGTCDLRLQTASTESEGGTTGVPVLTVSVAGTSVRSEQSTATSVQVATASTVQAEPCEIDALCDEDEGMIRFSATLRTGSDNELSGTLTVSPGGVVVPLTGTTQTADGELRSFEAEGEAVVDGLTTTATLSCRQ